MTQVRRRCVFYVSGFDPKGAAHYHGLYKEQAALQAQVNGLAIEVGARKRMAGGNSSWTLKANDRGTDVETHYEFMRWDDVVRAHWPKRQWQLWRDVVVTTWFYLRHGALWKMYRLSWPPAVAVFTPFALLMAMLLGVPLLASVAAWMGWRSTGSAAASALAAAGAAAVLVWVGLALESRYSMYWMMRSYAFTRRQARARTPDLEARLDEHARRLAERLREGIDDEVLVVGHSSGANMAASIVARALRLPHARDSGPAPRLSLLTLGQWLPLLGLLPQAVAFRQELAELGTAPALDWIDFSAPPDGCCFALTDPLAGCGTRAAPLPDRPKLLSPKFAELFDPASYQELKGDKFRMHFQYLMASRHAGRYDYFLITAGCASLAGRFAADASVTDYRGLRPWPARVAGRER